MSDHQLIIFYGSSPGAGKSTLSSFLYEQFSVQEIPVWWVYEDDVLAIPLFAEFVADIQSGNPKMMDSLVRATKAFVQECLRSGVVAITDSIFPCTNWLLATGLYSYEELIGFGIELERLLAPLRPLVIYLDADPSTALRRATQQRGEQWFEELVALLNTYNVNRMCPLTSFDDVAGYFQLQAQLSLDALQQWSCALMLFDAVRMPLGQIQASVLGHLGLTHKESTSSLGRETTHTFLGVYRSEDPAPPTIPLVIGMVNGRLHANTYWPNGCHLVVEGSRQFRLEHTSHRIIFEMQPNGLPESLIYHTAGKQFRFRKVAPDNG